MSRAHREGDALARAVDELALVDAYGDPIPLRARVVDEGYVVPIYRATLEMTTEMTTETQRSRA